MSESPRWYRSLYWRIGLGLLAFLALMLGAQGTLFLWTTERIAGSMPANSPQRLAELVASDIGSALADDPRLDLQQYVDEHYGNVFQAFVVVMRDRRTAANHDDVTQAMRDELLRAAEARWRFAPRRFPLRGFDPDGRGGPGPGPGAPGFDDRGGPGFDRRGGPGFDGRAGPGPDGRGSPGPFFPPRGGVDDDGPPPDGPRGRPLGPGERGRVVRQRGLPPPGRAAIAPIVLDAALTGDVIVLPGGPPFSRIARELGPTMGVVGGAVLAIGAALIALVVFRPVRRRLHAVQEATEQLGQGDLAARAPEHGGDEVAALARSFNRMAEELRIRAEKLQVSDRVRRQLLADVSHELNTPLTAMRGYLETLAMPDLALDEATRQRYVAIVTEETQRLERIIGDLLDLARLEGGGSSLRQSRVDVCALFERVADRHERELRARAIELVQQVDEGAETLVGDGDRLEQALQNLAANALRYTPDGGRLTLSATRIEDAVQLTVRDSGSGIAPDQLPHVFDRFYKADASRKSEAGSGLGLSIVKAIVERHGGTITARNEGGAVFDIRLPLHGMPSL